jgi:hypothetical protein
VQLLVQQCEADRLARLDRLGVLDQVAELAVAVVAERGVQRDRLPAVLLYLDDLFRVMSSSAASSPGVGSLGRPDQAQVALLDQIQQQHPPAGTPPGQRDHQAQVGLHQMVLGPPAVLGDPLQVTALTGAQHPAAFGELVIGEHGRLDPLGQLDLLPGVEQRHLADLLEVVLDRVGRSATHCHLGGGQAPAVIAGNQRLVLTLLARCLRRAGGASRGAALAGAWLRLT